MSGTAARAKRIALGIRQTLPVRAWARFAERNGGLLASGMSYNSLFAVFAALWVGFSVAGIWIRADPVIYAAVLNIIKEAVPGLIGGAVPVEALDGATLTLSITGVVALGALVWTLLGWIDSTRRAIRAIMGGGGPAHPLLLQKAIDLGGAAAFGLVLVAAAVLSLASTALVRVLAQPLGFADSPGELVAARIAGLVVVFLLDFAVLVAMYRWFSGLRMPRRALVEGAGLAGLGLMTLSTLGGLLVGGAGRNPLLASFAVLVGLLLWFDFACTAVLLGASWIAARTEPAALPERRTPPVG